MPPDPDDTALIICSHILKHPARHFGAGAQFADAIVAAEASIDLTVGCRPVQVNIEPRHAFHLIFEQFLATTRLQFLTRTNAAASIM